jgi:hypothetical protein
MTTDIATPVASPSITGIPEQLGTLGVGPDTLSEAQREALDRDGFLLLPSHLRADELETLRQRHDELMSQKYGQAPSSPPTSNDHWFHEPGTRRLNDLLSEGEIFERMALDPILLAATWRLMGRPFKHDSINAREASPGQGGQPFHRDGHRTSDGGTQGVNSAWLLDPFTEDNGPTRVIPGSHRWTSEVIPDFADYSRPHPLERPILAPAGSVFIFAGTLWHSGTTNRTATGRRVVHVSHTRREIDLGGRSQRLRIRKATWDRLSPAARWIVDA